MKKQNLKIFRIVLLLGTLISLYFVPWPIVKAWLIPLPDNVQTQVNKATDYGFDGIIVYVDKANKTPTLYAAGTKNRIGNVPADPKALFKIASVDKLYNAVAVSKLVYNGTLDLDKTLSDYLPELQDRIAYANTISIRMLVQHRSGIPNYTDTFNYWSEPKTNDDDKLALILDKPANFKPDTAYAYCNTNYLLLSRIMERVLGYDPFIFIHNAILNPLNLNQTYASINAVNLDDVMSGYYVGYDTDLKSNPVGSMLATAEDLGKFIRALNDGSVFKNKKEQDIYTSIYKYEHTGLIPGYQTIAKYHEDIDTVVIQFTNTVDFEGYNWNLSEIMYNRIVKILKGT
ncbi:serine hydrolase domain-containing protein [Formosa algae]|uniref:CubicO group peptidase (Beta-lactamase class C family) n=1 Tax=Formosa algae TaxID=225843 RepID=A0A9X0YP43_9FLAO|nr:serine hydrolase domain-containing protein [Formosa algae]MBP1840792.1 CubicO group peptidase (beta-lactamase class C family) [Formosa algae]MDQ0336311.1 CubicO group peptidase (beta-lactamase class C family) [Formosa algae]OEI80337.1 serine hydrolase [Formosa algae]